VFLYVHLVTVTSHWPVFFCYLVKNLFSAFLCAASHGNKTKQTRYDCEKTTIQRCYCGIMLVLTTLCDRWASLYTRTSKWLEGTRCLLVWSPLGVSLWLWFPYATL